MKRCSTEATESEPTEMSPSMAPAIFRSADYYLYDSNHGMVNEAPPTAR